MIRMKTSPNHDLSIKYYLLWNTKINKNDDAAKVNASYKCCSFLPLDGYTTLVRQRNWNIRDSDKSAIPRACAGVEV